MAASSFTAREVARTCLCLHMQRAARAVGRRYDKALRPVGLTNGQFSILLVLSRPMPTGISDIVALLGLDRTTLTAALKPLERRGLVQLGTGVQDRRARQIGLTDAGREVVGAAMPHWERAQAELGALMGDTDLEVFRAELRSLA